MLCTLGCSICIRLLTFGTQHRTYCRIWRAPYSTESRMTHSRYAEAYHTQGMSRLLSQHYPCNQSEFLNLVRWSFGRLGISGVIRSRTG